MLYLATKENVLSLTDEILFYCYEKKLLQSNIIMKATLDSIRSYFTEIGRVPLLLPEQEIQLDQS